MGVNVIFRIAAVGILVSVLCQVLKHSGRRNRHFNQSGGTDPGVVVDDPVHI